MSYYEPDEATAREDMCRFLSACFYEPAEEFAEEDLFGSIVTAAGRIRPELAVRARALQEAFSKTDLQTLLIDYSRLFLGPMQALARPYGSSWMPSPVSSDTPPSAAVLELYRAGGLDLDEGFADLPDHVAVELEFLYLLTFRRNDAQNTGETEALDALENLERKFLREHLGAWIQPFASAIKSGAHTSFYRELAELAEQFVRTEEARLGIVH